MSRAETKSPKTLDQSPIEISRADWIERELKNAPPLSESRARRLSQLLHLGGAKYDQ